MTTTTAWPVDAVPESTWTRPTNACPHPGRWHSTDDDSTEIEVSALVGAFVRAIQPDLVLETGTAWGQTAQAIGEALAANGQGELLTCEIDAERVAASAARCAGLPVEVVQRTSEAVLIELVQAEPQRLVQFAWLDSLFDLRLSELAALRFILAPGAVVGIHDCGEPGGAKFDVFSRTIAGHALGWGFSRISLPTPRGVTFLSWPGGQGDRREGASI